MDLFLVLSFPMRKCISIKIHYQHGYKNFFPTFTFKRVKGIFRQIGYLDGIATLLTLLCTEAPREVVEYDGTKYFVAVGDRCLPQGSPASPGLTNIACMRLDRRLDGLTSKVWMAIYSIC